MWRSAIAAVVLPLLSTFSYEAWKLSAHFLYQTGKADPSSTMRAISYATHGGPEVLQVGDVPKPGSIDRGLVLVRIAAASLNPVDFKMRRNPQPDAVLPKPKIPGCDVSGVVVEVGEGTPFQPGDRVFGMLPIVGQPWGGLAEYTVADHRVLALAPRSIPLVAAAALPLVGLTTLQTLDPAIEALPRDATKRALVQAAAGGVGSFAVQWLRHVHGFDEVIATASPRHHELVSALGATAAIDYTSAEGASHLSSVKGMDVVLDPVAWKYMEHTLDPSSGILRPGGWYCHILSTDWKSNAEESSPTLPLFGPFRKWATRFQSVFDRSTRRVYSSAVVPDAEGLARIARHVDEGKLRPSIAQTVVGLDLERVREAFAVLEEGRSGGKILVRPTAEDWWEESGK